MSLFMLNVVFFSVAITSELICHSSTKRKILSTRRRALELSENQIKIYRIGDFSSTEVGVFVSRMECDRVSDKTVKVKELPQMLRVQKDGNMIGSP